MNQATKILLHGEWNFAADPQEVGINYCGGWFLFDLPERVQIPGDMIDNQKGIANHVEDWDSMGLPYVYAGAAWYQKMIEIPHDWAKKAIFLHIARSSRTMAWVDDVLIGSNDMVQTPQCYRLDPAAHPGRHRLTIRVNNAPVRPSGFAGSTQNGLLGEVFLQARDRVRIGRLAVRPSEDLTRVEATLYMENDTGRPVEGSVRLTLRMQGKKVLTKHLAFRLDKTQKKLYQELYLGEDALKWDAFTPNLYQMEAVMEAHSPTERFTDTVTEPFGFYRYSTQDRKILVNNRPIYLRGDLGLLQRALTYCTHMEIDSLDYWRERLGTLREYGLNHIRFHMHCPPEALFQAADELGMYVQVELALGGYVCEPGSPRFEPMLEPSLKRQGEEIFKAFGNHPSLMILTLGNEIEGDSECLGRVVEHIRKCESGRLYAQGSNNNLNDPFPLPNDDLFITNKMQRGHRMARGSCAFADYPEGLVQGETLPNTWRDLSYGVGSYLQPVVGHEIGQYENSPNFDDIALFRKEVQPRNLLAFRRNMERNGLLHKEKDFLKASMQLSGVCMREEVELNLRTEGMGGYQLGYTRDGLMEGSAMCGWLFNALGSPKGSFTPREFRMFVNDGVFLLRMDKYVYRSGESLKARVDLLNYMEDDVVQARCQIRLLCGETVIREGTIEPVNAAQGENTPIGWIEWPLLQEHAACLTVEMILEGYEMASRVRIWVFPDTVPQASDAVISKLDKGAKTRLENGEKLLLFADDLSPEYSVDGHFASNFYCYTMFQRMSYERGVPVSPGTMGICCNPAHPALHGFPTREGSDWQWWQITMNSRPAILDGLPQQLEPIVWVIDNPMRAHRLGLIYEVKVGKGGLLICMADLPKLSRKHAEAGALYQALLDYVGSVQFAPQCEVAFDQLSQMFN